MAIVELKETIKPSFTQKTYCGKTPLGYLFFEKYNHTYFSLWESIHYLVCICVIYSEQNYQHLLHAKPFASDKISNESA